jgi:hypothetical protein
MAVGNVSAGVHVHVHGMHAHVEDVHVQVQSIAEL